MKIQIDTTAKTIKVEETVKIQELIDVLKKLLPNDWKDYSLMTDTVINWYPSYPIVYYDLKYPQPLPVTYTTHGAVCNVEVN